MLDLRKPTADQSDDSTLLAHTADSADRILVTVNDDTYAILPSGFRYDDAVCEHCSNSIPRDTAAAYYADTATQLAFHLSCFGLPA